MTELFNLKQQQAKSGDAEGRSDQVADPENFPAHRNIFTLAYMAFLHWVSVDR